MQYQNAGCFAVSVGRPHRSVAPLCASHGGSVGVIAAVELIGLVAVFEPAGRGLVAVFELASLPAMFELAG